MNPRLIRLGKMLAGHEVTTVPQRGWAGVRNGRLLALAAREFEVFLTMDQNLEHQQNMATLPIAVIVVVAVSHRIEHVAPLVPDILQAIVHLPPRALHRVGA